MIGYLLFIFARLMTILCMPLGILYTVVRRITRLRSLGRYFLDMAYAYDVLINVCYGDFFNDVLRKPGGYDYGNPNDSISRATGKNKLMGTLKKLGIRLADFLNWVEKEHVEKAAQ